MYYPGLFIFAIFQTHILGDDFNKTSEERVLEGEATVKIFTKIDGTAGKVSSELLRAHANIPSAIIQNSIYQALSPQ